MSCGSRIKCFNPAVSFGTTELFVYKIDKYTKGSGFTQLIESKTDTAKPYGSNGSGSNTYQLDSDFDWVITVLETNKTFSVEKIRYETYKARTTFGDSHGSNTNCHNTAVYTVNGVEHILQGKAWRYGSGPIAKPDFYITK
jgi:hypothetical protein